MKRCFRKHFSFVVFCIVFTGCLRETSLSLKSSTSAPASNGSTSNAEGPSRGPGSVQCVRKAPTVNFEKPSQTATSPDQNLTYRVTVANRDLPSCGSSTYKINASADSNLSYTVSVSALAIGPAQTKALTFLVKGQSRIKNGSFPISITVRNQSAPQFIGYSAGTFVMDSKSLPPSPSPRPSPSPSSSPRPRPEPTFKTTVEWEIPSSPHAPNDPNTPLWTYKGNTYFIWVDQNRRPTVEKRRDGVLVEKALLDPNGYQCSPDGHYRYSMGIDRNGYLHIIGDMHNYTEGGTSSRTYPTYLHKKVLYWKSNRSESVSRGFTFAGEKETALPGDGWISATARFFTDNDGELFYSSSIHAIESGVSGKVGVGLYKYNLQRGTWTAIGALADNIAPGAKRSPVFFWEQSGWGGGVNWFQHFQPSFKFDRWNHLHFAVTVHSDSFFVKGANRIVYARSDDGGVHWKKANGRSIPGFPIRAKDGTANQGDIVADASDIDLDVRNPNGKYNYFGPTVGVVADKNGKPGVGVHEVYSPDSGNDTTQQVWRTWDGTRWSKNQNIDGHTIYGYRTPDDSLIFLSPGYQQLVAASSFDEKPTEYRFRTGSENYSRICSVDEYGLRTTGVIYSIGWDRGQNKQFVLKTIISP